MKAEYNIAKNALGVGFKALLFSDHMDSIATCGLIMDEISSERPFITSDLLGDKHMETVNTGEEIKIGEDGTVDDV